MIRSVVALPATVQAQEEDNFFADAFPNTLTTHLSQIQGLETKVAPRASELERSGVALDRLGDVYDVDAFVLSSVIAEGERIVLNVQLVEARDRGVLWSADFEGERGRYIDLVRKAAEGVGEVIRPASDSPGAGKTSSSEAELQFQRGMYHQHLFNNLHQEMDFRLALSAFERVLDLDPKMADAAAV